MIQRSAWLLLPAAVALLSLPAQAQNLVAGYTLPANANLVQLNSGTTISFPNTAVKATVTATIVVQNLGSSPGSIDALSVTGAGFQLSNISFFTPLTMAPGASVSFGLRFSPTVVGDNLGTLSLAMTGQALSVPLSGTGTTSALTVAYTLPTNQNAVPLAAGGTLQFPPTALSTATTATVVVGNATSSPASIDSLSLIGSAFQLVGVSFVTPFLVPANSSVAFGIRYAPTQVASDTGTLSLGLAGNVLTATLAGSGVLSVFSYSVVTAAGNVPFLPNQAVPVPDTNLGATTNVVIQVQNTSPTPAAVGTIAATPAVYSLSNVPVLPAVLNPNQTLTFTLTFSPVQTGSAAGSLRVANDQFTLAANGLGSKFTFTYGTGTPITVPSGGAVIFSPTQVGQTSQTPFIITNSGTAAGTIASIAVADTRGVFSLLTPPSLPATLNPGDTVTVPLVFTPATTGFATSTLQIDTQVVTLSGAGTLPPPIPSFQFTGASGTVNPLQQPAIGLTLSAPYPLPLTGVLTITLNSSAFTPDATVQIATGGKTVPFTIPANSTQAVFPASGTQILLQSGSTAGTITISPTFATKSGLDLTPAAPPAVVLTVPASAPALLKVQITNATQLGFAVSVSGYSTPHSLSTLTYSFTPAGGGTPAPYVLDVSSAANLWFNGAASQQFGGQFSVSVPFTITNPSATALATTIIQSVSVTATNAQGASAPVKVTVQ